MKLMVFAASFACLLLVVACSDDEEAAPGSGIEGRVLAGPQCPVEREGSPCPDLPLAATIDVYTADRTRKVASFTSDEDGRFEADLPPGSYYIDPQPIDSDNPFPRPLPTTAAVREGEWTELTIEYDTGIR